MVTAVTLTAGTAAAATPAPAAATPQLSDFAQSTLDGIGRMQADFATTQAQMKASTAPVGQPGQPISDSMQMINALRESNAMAMKVQQQMYQFSMASSVSNSLSSNLNSFLKGS